MKEWHDSFPENALAQNNQICVYRRPENIHILSLTLFSFLFLLSGGREMDGQTINHMLNCIWRGLKLFAWSVDLINWSHFTPCLSEFEFRQLQIFYDVCFANAAFKMPSAANGDTCENLKSSPKIVNSYLSSSIDSCVNSFPCVEFQSAISLYFNFCSCFDSTEGWWPLMVGLHPGQVYCRAVKKRRSIDIPT